MKSSDSEHQRQLYEYRMKRYELFLQERKSLTDSAEKASSGFAKAIMTLAAATLGFSLTFVKYVIGDNPIVHKEALIITWFASGLALIFIVTSYLLAHYAYLEQIEQLKHVFLDEDYDQDSDISSVQNFYSKTIHWLNWFTLICFLTGVGSLIFFSSKNIF